jgi:hypothetical protein
VVCNKPFALPREFDCYYRPSRSERASTGKLDFETALTNSTTRTTAKLSHGVHIVRLPPFRCGGMRGVKPL